MSTITLSPLEVSVGEVIQFCYPIDNRIRVSTRLRRRRFVVEAIRDCDVIPITPLTRTLRPDLRRGRFLLWGRDLDLNQDRRFYLSSARSLKLLDLQLSQLAIYDSTRDDLPLEFFGQVWTDSRKDVQRIKEEITRINIILSARGNPRLAVGLFPFSKAG